jgi:hypothetical protein
MNTTRAGYLQTTIRILLILILLPFSIRAALWLVHFAIGR